MSFFHVRRDQSLELFIVLKPDKTCEIAERKLHNNTFQVPVFLMSVPAKPKTPHMTRISAIINKN
jgi:hypothetical protein